MSSMVAGRFSAEDVYNNLNLGLIMLDKDFNILLWNEWMVRHSHVPAESALNSNFIALFNQQLAPGFLRALSNTISYGLPAMLSSALHRSPLPLYHVYVPNDGEAPARMVQSVVMTPIPAPDGSRSCLIQISDSSNSVKREKILLSHSEALKRQVVTDGLTGVNNRRFFDENFTLALQQSMRNDSPLSLFMIDIDFFKQYNDHYGHVAGDRVLKRVAETLKGQLKSPTDVFARYGGEEFILLVGGMDKREAKTFAEQLRESVHALEEPHDKSLVNRCMTISVGVCTRSPQEEADGRNLLATADAALYRAKLGGRNKVVATD
ncbi:sensor domain-containing diguanylate cyclase [Herbaspirillum robiniae]|uniref:diguanylate cyclase n=1 Tax=Herbaspirillum robiniae TaxID=2014887 RepID=A0A246WWC8_9BURK|nr:GGDEF domain-containing protein [Herbaspirillum robiniae]NUU00276.1 GGDEF domain-containing protein [Herbaspirillum robiniae]OWY31001.1 diguanylate cyclase [Herbaspirillum robiniae]